jgi:nucleoside-diphosphate-sugar epimerase
MDFSEIKTEESLWKFMTTPSERLIESVYRLEGPVMILGGSGKMGKELVALLKNADSICGKKRAVYVASTFSHPSGKDIDLFKNMGVRCFKGDLSDESFLKILPNVPNVIFMMGFKFGSSNDWQRSFHLNSITPFLVGSKYANSKIVVFSSGNPYPHSPKNGKGCPENVLLDPIGIYGWSIVARESSFSITAQQHKNQKIAFYRLMYAQHLGYGVLIDLARMVYANEPISLAMPAVNLVSQREANEIALCSFDHCQNNPWTVNVAGPVWSVREIVYRIEKHLGKKAVLLQDEADLALIADDSMCVNTFGEYQDLGEDMIKSAAWWVEHDGAYWNKPTFFGRAKHDY